MGMYIFTTFLIVVIRTKPELPNVDTLVKDLNQTNDINTFLRNVRNAFKTQVPETDSYVC